mmetsp:Transcript_152974/g.285042  ORF Transcript_152974/g.285042 Transcript_152974/m.285042 type:complete len:640 (-) Transcript_152974:274-2193(-)
MNVKCPDLQEALTHLPRLLQVLTELSLQSTATLLPRDGSADDVLLAFEKNLENLSSLLALDEDRLNPKWNKSYGEGGTFWSGALDDGRSRGNLPYYCPEGWVRFALKVCSDEEFATRFADWGYLYHGTNSKHVGPILASGFKASKGLCFCGKDDSAVYMSPSIEYCGHPRYGCIDYNPETRKWTQVVLQCRVKPSAVWQRRQETMKCARFNLRCDKHISNDQIEWLFKPTYFDEASGSYFIKDEIICTGIMIRITDRYPCEMPFWWSQSEQYLREWRLAHPIINPVQSLDDSWNRFEETIMEEFSGCRGDITGENLELISETVNLGKSWLAPYPFAKGGMRFAWYLCTGEGSRRRWFVLKSYNKETLKHMTEGLQIDEEQGIMKEVSTYVVAGHLAKCFNKSLPEDWDDEANHINFLKPCVFRLKGARGETKTMFGEEYVKGDFIKWNNNAGYVNQDRVAGEQRMNEVCDLFGHYTWSATKGRLMVVDIQGWQLGKRGARKILFTDPQIHSRSASFSRKRRVSDPLFRRYSLGNLGKTGMLRFFKNHQCSCYCKERGLKPFSLEHGVQDFDFRAMRHRGSVLAMPSIGKACPAGHALVKFATPHSRFKCDECDQFFAQGATLHGCRACDYDVCEKCLGD